MFGAMLEPERAVDAVALAVLAEQAGLDAVSLCDHPYWPERLDTFALLAVIAARTDRCGSSPTWPTCRCARRRCSPEPRPPWIS